MGGKNNSVYVVALLLLIVAIADAEGPPGLQNPSHATCSIKKYKHCYNLVHVCPKFCPETCHVECVSCKPICGPDSAPPPEDEASPPPNTGGEGKSPPPPEDDGKEKSPPPSDDGKGKGDDDGKGKGDDDNGKGKSPPPSDDDDKGKGDDGDGDGKGKSPPPSDDGKGDDNGKGKGDDGDDDDGKGKGGDDDNDGGKGKGKGDDDGNGKPSSPPSYPPPSPTPSPPKTTPPSPSPTPTPPASPPPPTPIPTPPTPTTPPTTPTPSTPPTSTPPTPPASPPMPPAPVPPAPPGAYVPVPSESGNGLERHRCKNKKYTQCYGVEHVCPASCPSTCEIDCVTCKPVCNCDMPGAVCEDPRFIGGDGITFYFHGKRERDFCLVTDPNLHINAHFIGRRNAKMRRDFTWVQSIAILFGDHQLFLGAQKTAAWDSTVDRFSLSFDGEPIALSAAEGATWRSAATSTSITRDSDTNSMVIQVEGLVKISAKVVPVSVHESRVHNYGVTEEDCFAHLELAFKFFSLNANVNGVLGQTYRDNYVSRVKMGVPMPVLGGEREFAVSNIFAPDCAASLFRRLPENDEPLLQLPTIKCRSTGINGRGGVVCKR